MRATFSKSLAPAAYLYLLVPFILFCLGWLRLTIALPLALFLCWLIVKLWRQNDAPAAAALTPAALIVLAGWVLLSGVGGYAFQNYDHNGRNALFRDLITHAWPVIYSSAPNGPVRELVYYVGFWLPAALGGKILGWKFANLLLFLWTWLGALLTAAYLSVRLNASMLKCALLLIFFSGMDALGTILLPRAYPTLWPPITHLEIWAGDLQYSSFTTQLFWVFNQSVPAWLCIALLLGKPRRELAMLIWALCFFVAPLAALGLLPYLLIDLIQARPEKISDLVKELRLDLLLAAALVGLISVLFFSSNTAAQERSLQGIALQQLIPFFLMEAGILWLLLAPRRWRDPRWIVTGLLLFFLPFIHVGSANDFGMRASIAPLFYLLLWSGEEIFQSGISTRKLVVAIVLCVGALTPLYEINRSIYRTVQYYFFLDPSERTVPPTAPATHLEQGGAPEYEHPGTLLADEIQTLEFMTDKLSKNYVANVRQSLYYRWLAPP